MKKSNRKSRGKISRKKFFQLVADVLVSNGIAPDKKKFKATVTRTVRFLRYRADEEGRGRVAYRRRDVKIALNFYLDPKTGK